MKKTIFSIIVKFFIVVALIIYIPNKQLTDSRLIEAGLLQLTSNPNEKSIFIYNTHQSEQYIDSNVIESTKYLAQKLIEKGYNCHINIEDFDAYRMLYDIDYSQSYSVSKIFIEEQITSDIKYDLIIDVHRDSIDKDLSTINYNNLDYAKVLFVVGKTGTYYDISKGISEDLNEIINNIVPGLGRGVYEKNSHYNQGISNNMILLELGAYKNTKEEVENTMNVVIEAIERYFSGL